MGNYKLIALDMDGTVLNDRQEISRENAEWIHKAEAAGIRVCFATGRGFRSALPYAEELKLDSPMITVNGSELWAKPYVLHRRTLLEPETVRRLREVALQSDAWYWAYAVDGIYNRETWVEPEQDYGSKHWLKFGYYTEDDPLRQSILQEVQSWGGLEITNSSPQNIELNPKGITKAAALEELCSLMHIGMDQVVAMGDSLNDLAMIQSAGLGIAMGNAQEEVKAEANFITRSNNDHGVAYVIENLVLKG